MRWICCLLLAGLPLIGARADDLVHAGIINSLSDATLFMAVERGYFRDVGISVDIVSLDSGGKMIAPLGNGDLDVAGGAPSAGLYNAVERGIQLRIVADRTTTDPHSDYQTLLVRKSLVDSGQFRSLADLKGRKIAVAAPGIAVLSVVNEAARAGGIAYDDVEKVYLPFPAQIAAFANGAVDASIIIEPYGTLMVEAGTAVRFVNTETFYPDNQIGVMLYSEAFATRRREVAVRFMTGLMRAMRDYVAAVRDGRIQGPGSDAIIDTLVRHFGVTAELARRLYTQRIDPNGRVNIASIRKDWLFFKAQNLIRGSVPPEQVVDMSFVAAAAAALGPIAGPADLK